MERVGGQRKSPAERSPVKLMTGRVSIDLYEQIRFLTEEKGVRVNWIVQKALIDLIEAARCHPVRYISSTRTKKNMSIRLPVDLVDQVKNLAKSREVKVCDVLNTAIYRFLQGNKGEP